MSRDGVSVAFNSPFCENRFKNRLRSAPLTVRNVPMADIRLLLTDKVISALAAPEDGWYLARDTELKGFFVVVGKRKRTFTVQGDLREGGKRVASVRIAIGDCDQISTRTARATAKSYLGQLSQGQHPKAEERAVKVKEAPLQQIKEPPSPSGVTLKEAWHRYRDAHLVRKERSEKTITGYRDHIERIFVDWLDTPLKSLGEDPAIVIRKYDALTQENGPYMANAAMRTLRAVYNHARKANRELPASNPVGAIDWNGEKRRNTAMGTNDLKGWFLDLAKINNPIRREFHLFTLLSGCRPEALKQVKPEHIDFRRRVLHVPKPKGGAKRAFDIPLSRQMLLCLARAIRFGRAVHPNEAMKWVFPAESATGHLAEQKEDRDVLAKWGNELRQSFRTIAAVAGVSEFDARLLMNHAIPGVNAGYITRHKLLEDHLRSQQQAISTTIFGGVGTSISQSAPFRHWLAPGAARRAINEAKIETNPSSTV
jgi:integrase